LYLPKEIKVKKNFPPKKLQKKFVHVVPQISPLCEGDQGTEAAASEGHAGGQGPVTHGNDFGHRCLLLGRYSVKTVKLQKKEN
jgi:hypothetical protein